MSIQLSFYENLLDRPLERCLDLCRDEALVMMDNRSSKLFSSDHSLTKTIVNKLSVPYYNDIANSCINRYVVTPGFFSHGGDVKNTSFWSGTSTKTPFIEWEITLGRTWRYF